MILEIYVFAIGLCVGSFMNVCIYRLPDRTSIIHPGSRCPRCGSAIRFYDNIPVFSYLLLRGRCRHCSASIPVRYPMVELLGGTSALAAYLSFGLTVRALVAFIFIATLIVVTFIDIDHRKILDRITLPGIPLFSLASLAIPSVSIVDSLLGILAGGGSLLLVATAYSLLTGREGMGGGDIKLLAMIGAMVGWQGVLFTIFASSAIGTITGLLLMLRQREGMRLAVPFGPFLSIGAVAYLFFGPGIISWYLHFYASPVGL